MELVWKEKTVMDAVRGYILELRKGRGVTQDELAEVIGMTKQALLEWEKGRTQELKGTPMLKAVEHLKGAAEDLMRLVDASFEQGMALARQRLKEPEILDAVQHQRLDEAVENIPKDQLDEVARILQELQKQGKTGEWLNFGRFLRG